MRARNAGNSLCASCTVPVHTSCSGSLPGPSRACSSRLYSLVPTPVLLADVFSGVRIGEERRNVLTGEDSYWRDESIVRMPFSCQEYFCTFFQVAPFFFPFYAPFSLSFRPVSPSPLHFFLQPLCGRSHTPIQLVVLFCPAPTTARTQTQQGVGRTGRRSIAREGEFTQQLIGSSLFHAARVTGYLWHAFLCLFYYPST